LARGYSNEGNIVQLLVLRRPRLYQQPSVFAMGSPADDQPSSYRTRIVPIVAKIAHGTTPFITTFLLIHLSAPVLANLGGTSLASQVMILGREYYQTSFGENYLVLAPLLIHGAASSLKRYLTPPPLRRKYTSLLSLTGTLTASLFLPIHFLTHRVYPMDPSPPIYAVGPAELDYELVKAGLTEWPWRSWILYGGLTLCVAWHAAEGSKVIWNLYLRDAFGAWRTTVKTRMIGASLAVAPVLTGLLVMFKEPLMVSSYQLAQFRAALTQSWFYKF